MELHRAGKEYLKTILVLEQQNGTVRSLDIARTLRVTKPSVSKAMKRLREGGYLTMDGNKRINLTKPGREIAEQTIRLHRSLASCLIAMGVDPAIAQRDACQMEHSLSPETLDKCCCSSKRSHRDRAPRSSRNEPAPPMDGSLRHSASLGQALTHSMQRMHSVPLARFLELSVTSTSMGHTRLHLPQETHLLLSQRTRSREK